MCISYSKRTNSKRKIYDNLVRNLNVKHKIGIAIRAVGWATNVTSQVLKLDQN